MVALANHLPILPVLIPLLAAPTCVLLQRPHAVKLFASLAAWCSFATALGLAARILVEGTISYSLGGWPAPIGIVYEIDALNAFLMMIVTANASIILPYASTSLGTEIPRERQYLLYTLLLLCLAGLLGIVATGDLFNVFVFLEIASLSSYALISMGRGRRGLTAAFQYLIMGTIGSTFILIGVGLMYMLTGTLNMADLACRLAALDVNRTQLCGFAFLTVGVSIKMALFPLHSWLPNAYTYAPSSVSAFIASTSTKVSLYIFLRVLFCISGTHFVFGTLQLQNLLVPLALVAMVSASTVAIFQDNIKRLLAYSSVAQIGYMVLGIGLANLHGLTGTVIHLMNHALMKGGLFLAVGCLIYRTGSPRLQDLKGAGRSMPWTSAAIVLGGLNLIGVPLTAGFISKWHLLLGTLDRDWWWATGLLLFGSLLAAIYVWRVVETLYFETADKSPQPPPLREAPLSMLIPTWIMLLATLVFGIHAQPALHWARSAASLLLEGVAL